ncbi:hypothetical protein [Psychroserpens sp. MEBiC05023]
MNSEKKIKNQVIKNKANYPIGLNDLVIKPIDKTKFTKVIKVDLYETDRYPVHTFYKHITRFL